MASVYCALCDRPVEGTRHIGVGTIVAAVLTAGISLLFVPFYRRRCSICRSTAITPTNPYLGAGERNVSPRHVAELEQKLDTSQTELEDVNEELDRLRTERDFYRQLLGDKPGLDLEVPPDRRTK
ncbi:hypothetical protein BH23GEM10_BH23GEM10_17750 [soil metagenome]